MARFDFSRLSVLVVEDSAFMRSLLVNVLRGLGVDRVLVAEDGEQAIHIMRPTGAVDSMVGTTGVDLVLCDYFMPTVDGTMFLRWLRRSDQSPDRFLPVIMVSAAADAEVLFTARDAGMDEFIAKPFAPAALAQRIISVAENPRPYIYAKGYFGPNRRRKRVEVKTERRVRGKDDIETVYSGKDISALKSSDKEVWEFRIPRSLKQKLAGRGAGDPDAPLIDPDLLKAAEDKIAEMEGDYSDWVAETIEELSQAHHRALEDPGNAVGQLRIINRVGHELRGQGGIFGYPLMTQFGKSLYDVTGEDARIGASLLDLIDAHIDLIRIVTKQKIKGDGGAIGKQLLGSLVEARKKFLS
jgi:CheY-like chemotaxis protein